MDRSVGSSSFDIGRSSRPRATNGSAFTRAEPRRSFHACGTARHAVRRQFLPLAQTQRVTYSLLRQVTSLRIHPIVLFASGAPGINGEGPDGKPFGCDGGGT
jgi:hypothetical protein